MKNDLECGDCLELHTVKKDSNIFNIFKVSVLLLNYIKFDFTQSTDIHSTQILLNNKKMSSLVLTKDLEEIAIFSWTILLRKLLYEKLLTI